MDPGTQQPTEATGSDERVEIRTEAELRDYLWNTFGARIPSVRVCERHCSPWEAFTHIYFARSSMAVVKGSRGLAGKTWMQGLLAAAFATTYRGDVTILGGSGTQSKRVQKAMSKFWGAPNAPKHALVHSGIEKTRLKWGNEIEALTASQKSVRGPHPQLLLLDEVDEMDWDIFEAAMGQTMEAPGIPARTGIFSTHQYDMGTMSAILKMAREKGWPVFEWCYRETMEPHGWLSPAEVSRKRAEMTAQMWNTEVELQEPSQAGLAIDRAKVERMFYGEEIPCPPETAKEGEFPYREFEPPVAGASYATGGDWARTRDFVEIATLRDDVFPMRLVAYQRFRKRATPYILGKFEHQLKRYPGSAAHDATSLGGKIMHDLLTPEGREGAEAIEPYDMAGRRRANLFTNYILAIEHEEIVAPRVGVLYMQHKGLRNDDIKTGAKGHPPDGFVACAMAYRAADAAPLRLLSGARAAAGGNGNGHGDATQAQPEQPTTAVARALSFLSRSRAE